MFVKKSDVIESKILGDEEEVEYKNQVTNAFSNQKKSTIDISMFTSSKKSKEEMYDMLVGMISSEEKI